MDKEKLIDVSHISKQKESLTIAIPKKVADILDVKEGDIIAFKAKGMEISIVVIR